MSASVFAFPHRKAGPQPWTNDELAELYRVVEILGRAGLAVETDMGMSDEGDPWFVFCRKDSGDVIAHFARIGSNFVASSVAVDETYRGANFRQIVERMVESQPLILPPPGSGTRLLTHPVVILTAFVATALAHSEKMLSSDMMRAVDARWEHHQPTDDGHIAAKHKIGWFDSLQALFKTPLADGKMPHDGVNKEGQALSLASLIAIAMSALQPMVEKVTALSHVVADELAGLTHQVATSEASHSSQSSLDLPVVDGGQNSDGVAMTVAMNVNSHSDDSPQSHKTAATADLGMDAQKVVIDASAHVATTVVRAVGADDSVSHVPSPGLEVQTDSNSAFLAIQKVTTVAANAEPMQVHSDNPAAALPVITIDDVSPQALQVLHIVRNSGSAQSTDGTGNAAAQADAAATVDAGAGHVVAVQPAAPAAVVAAAAPAAVTAPVDLTVNVNQTDPSVVIADISNFLNNSSHVVAQQVTPSATLQQDLSSYFGTGGSLKVIVFDSTSSQTPDVFSFVQGVVFVEEKLLVAAQISNPGGTLTLDVTGGTVTLVGVTTINGHATV